MKNSPGINWPTTIYFLVIHIGAVVALFHFSWPLLVTCFLLSILGGLSVTLGYHRLLTHGAFQTYSWLRNGIAYIAALAGQGGPLMWVALHRQHHKFSDEVGDPHSPVVDSLPYAHMGWMVYDTPTPAYEKFCPDLLKSRFLRFLDMSYPLHLFGSGVLLAVFGGWPVFLWAWCLRIAFTNNMTWLVNSAAHRWGHQPFTQKDGSRNLWWVALLSLGEGWHNAHHAFPSDARHGKRAWEFDPTYITICVMEWLGLAWNVRR